MSHTPHELNEEFPAEIERIHALKTTNAHFARLVEEYNGVNQEVYRAETRIDPTSSEHEAMLRQKRLKLKDEIRRMLSAA
ncbi:YdcH family protein [Paracoccaceae bacterium Fryx2]|nr:YdcH family protein [Paracoccaceae bacterium Fryx2]